MVAGASGVEVGCEKRAILLLLPSGENRLGRAGCERKEVPSRGLRDLLASERTHGT